MKFPEMPLRWPVVLVAGVATEVPGDLGLPSADGGDGGSDRRPW